MNKPKPMKKWKHTLKVILVGIIIGVVPWLLIFLNFSKNETSREQMIDIWTVNLIIIAISATIWILIMLIYDWAMKNEDKKGAKLVLIIASIFYFLALGTVYNLLSFAVSFKDL